MSSLRQVVEEVTGSIHNDSPRYAVIHDEDGKVRGVYYNYLAIPNELAVSPILKHKHYKLKPREEDHR